MRYELAGAIEDLPFEEVLEFPAGTVVDPAEAGTAALIRLLHLAAGLSYYKAAAPPQIVVGGGLTKAEDTFLRELVLRGLGEFAYRNALPGPLAPTSQPRSLRAPRPANRRRPPAHRWFPSAAARTPSSRWKPCAAAVFRRWRSR